MTHFEQAGTSLTLFPECPNEYDALISVWMAHFSTLAYESKYSVAEELKEVGFSYVAFFDESGTQAYLARRPSDGEHRGVCVVAFRGTEGDYKDILSDATFFKRTIDYGHGFRAHGGFLSALRAVWGSFWKPEDLQGAQFTTERVGSLGITEKLVDLVQADDDLFFTGHSLGGAIANLAAYQYNREFPNRITATYTIGAPRTADRSFANYLRNENPYPIFRVVNTADIVPRVPPALLGFRHFGTCIYLTRNGAQKINPGLGLQIRNTIFGLAPLLYRLVPFDLLSGMKVRAFTDHSGSEYCRKLYALTGQA